MANPNKNDNTVQIEESKLKTFKQFSPLSFNPAGFTPTIVTYRVTLGQLRPVVLEFVKDILDDIQDVTFIINYKNGEISTFVWIPSNSRHLRDESTMTEKSAIRVPITRYSEKLKEFMERFCHNDNKRTIQEDHGQPLAGIQIDLARVAKMMFDENGNSASKELGVDRVQSRINLVPVFDRQVGDHWEKFLFVEIRKATKSGLEQSDPIPKRSLSNKEIR